MSEIQSQNINQNTLVSEAPPSPFKEFVAAFKENRGALFGFYIVCAIFLLAIFADLYPHSPTEILIDENGKLSLFGPLSQGHLLGTDPAGRDLLARLLHGARISLYLGMMAVTFSLAIGLILGLIAGYFGGFMEMIIMRLTDIILSIPAILMAMAVMAVLDKATLNNTALAIAISYTPNYIRIIRASVLAEKRKDYVMASRIAGASNFRLMVKAILPNCWAPIIVQASLGFSSAVLQAAALGFLGFGVQPPYPEWGTMLSENRYEMLTMWWAMAFPGLAILMTVMAFNLMGDGLRDALDPKMKS